MHSWNMAGPNDEQIARYRDTVRPVAAERMQREGEMATPRPAVSSRTTAVQRTAGADRSARPGVSAVLRRFNIDPDQAARDPKFIAMAAAKAARRARLMVGDVLAFAATAETRAGFHAAGMSDTAIDHALTSGAFAAWLARRGAL